MTVSPAGGTTCPGASMTFKCTASDSSGVASVRWRLTRNGADVISQISLTQGGSGDCSHADVSDYGDYAILVTLCASYSTLNTTANNQLDGIQVECLLIAIGQMVDVETLQIQITRTSQVIYSVTKLILIHTVITLAEPPPLPSDVLITNLHNGTYSASVELSWDNSDLVTNIQANDTTHTVAISISYTGETWMSTVAKADGRKNITLTYNINYSLEMMATNCAGSSRVYVTDIFIGIIILLIYMTVHESVN